MSTGEFTDGQLDGHIIIDGANPPADRAPTFADVCSTPESGHVGKSRARSALCQSRPNATQQKARDSTDLVGDGEHTRRNCQAKRAPAPALRLILHELLYGLVLGKSTEHVAVFVSRDAFRHVGVRPFLGDEGRHLAVFDAADPDTLPERHVDFLARLGIGRVENVVAVDVEAARPAPAL